ncbi:MAG: cell division protein FtsZ [Alphaproteobacteria bacterium]|nr:cell division protein FtsZ [Alphaproteobacteria bacterium]
MAIKLAVGDTNFTQLKPRITVIGVGGGGGNAISNMMNKKLEGVDFVVANTDAQALALSPATRKIQLGLEITQGLGAGARPEIGKLAAEEAKDDIEREIADSNMVFITAGMGGGTGSGAAPVVAKIAKEKGILTVGVVTKPFAFEGKKRMENAEKALDTFIDEVDSIIVIPNQNLFRIADKNTTLKDAFVKADEVLYDGVRSITDLMIMPGLINLDFADVKKIMADRGKAIMGTGEAEGEDRARVAAEQALANPILDDCSLKGASGCLINITGGSDITLMEIDEAVNIIKEELDDDAELIFGSSYDDSLSGRIRVSVVVTGIADDAMPRAPKNNINAYVELNTPVVEENVTPVISDEQNTGEEEINTLEETETSAVTNNVVEMPVASSDVHAPQQAEFAEMKAETPVEEPHVSSALFNAIINKPIVANTEDSPEAKSELAEVKIEKPFTPAVSVSLVEEEPQLFPEQGEAEQPFERAAREEAQAMIEEEPVQPTRQRFIDKILGISRAKAKKTAPKPVSVPKFDEIEDFAERESANEDDLEIPSFLRRR